jgi:Family of unknown function (DUF5681)
MSNPESQDQHQKTDLEKSTDDAANAGKGDYEVGFCRPPKQYQFKPGQSGNPRGRRRNSLSKKALWQKLMNEFVSLHEQGKTRKVTKYECLCLAHLNKAIKGDTRSAKFVIEEAERAGFGDLGSEGALAPQRDPIAPSGLLFDDIDPNVLLDDEKVELARLATIMDLGGGFTALSTRDFERAKDIVNKGKGKDITSKADVCQIIT